MTKQFDDEGHELYKTRVVGSAWGDDLLQTYTPEGVIYERSKTGLSATFDRRPSYVGFFARAWSCPTGTDRPDRRQYEVKGLWPGRMA